jgi:hypothetical protein
MSRSRSASSNVGRRRAAGGELIRDRWRVAVGTLTEADSPKSRTQVGPTSQIGDRIRCPANRTRADAGDLTQRRELSTEMRIDQLRVR